MNTYWQSTAGAIRKLFGYDAAVDRGRRKAATTTIKHEEHIARDIERRKLSTSAADLARNFSLAAWAIRKHLDYVSSFRFQGATGDREFDKDFEMLVAMETGRHRFDIARRHSLRRAIRLTEAHRLKDGDHFWAKFQPQASADSVNSARGKVLMIEADKIRTPKHGDLENFDADQWANGVQLGRSGQAVGYGLHTRTTDGRYQFQRVIPARNACHHAWFDRVDQVRGISPLASALNQFRDIYEGMEYSFAKMKVAQLFGLVTYRSDEFALPGPGVAEPTEDTDSDDVADAKYEVDLGVGAPFSLDLEPGDRAEILESKTPSTETVAFLQLMIRVVLRSLDLPMAFFDEGETNFYSSRGALIQYQKSCKHKVADLQEMLDEWSRWRFGLMIVDSQLMLPSGRDFTWLKWKWIPDGVPWWNRDKEVKGAKGAVTGGLDNPQRICAENDSDFFDNIDKIREAFDYARQQGVPLDYGLPDENENEFSLDEEVVE